MYRRAASGEVDEIGGGRGQSLGTVKPTFAFLVVEAICEVCFFRHTGAWMAVAAGLMRHLELAITISKDNNHE
jgi:hypothetical protein